MNNKQIIKMKPGDVPLYDRVEMISRRSVELERGKSLPKVETGGVTNPVEIAMMEFELGKIPFILERRLPNGESKFYQLESS